MAVAAPRLPRPAQDVRFVETNAFCRPADLLATVWQCSDVPYSQRNRLACILLDEINLPQRTASWQGNGHRHRLSAMIDLRLEFLRGMRETAVDAPLDVELLDLTAILRLTQRDQDVVAVSLAKTINSGSR